MFANNNRQVIHELGMDHLRIHKGRNILTILAIALTTILISAVLTVGASLTSTIMHSETATRGPGSDGYLTVTGKQYRKLCALPEITWTDEVQTCSIAGVQNDAFAGMDVEIRSAGSDYYHHNFIKPKEGRYPKRADEILISDTLAKRLHLKSPVGRKVRLRVVIGSRGAASTLDLSFTVCGCFVNPLADIKDSYDEIFTGSSFVTVYNPALEKEQKEVFVKLDNLNPLLLKTDVYDKLVKVREEIGGTGFTTNHINTLSTVTGGMIPTLLFAIFAMLSGYFLIYNVFYMSLGADIRWLGMMKTLGTTPRQIRKIQRVQMRWLALPGIAAGVFCGFFVGDRLAPGLIAGTTFGAFYHSPNIPIILGFAAVFSWITVCISARKSVKMAAAASSAQAAGYVRRKKRNVFTVISLSLSGMIFLVLFNLISGFQVDAMVKRYNMLDARVLQANSDCESKKQYQSLDASLLTRIRALPYVRQAYAVYRARTNPDSCSDGSYMSSEAIVRPTGMIKESCDAIWNSRQYREDYAHASDDHVLENGDVRLSLVGLPTALLRANRRCIRVLEGSLDAKRFATGDYCIWQDIQRRPYGGIYGTKSGIHAGDTMTLQLYNDETKTYKSRQLTVLAVTDSIPYDGVGDMNHANIVLPDQAFKKLYPDADRQISAIEIDTKGEITGQQNRQIQGLMGQTHNTQLELSSRFQTRSEMEHIRYACTCVGTFLTLLFGVIGGANVSGSILLDVLARRRELAVLRAVGMARAQQWWMLFADTLRFTVPSLLIVLSLGTLLSKLFAGTLRSGGCSMRYFVISGVCYGTLVLLFSLAVTGAAVWTLNRKSVVERLRTT